MTTLDIDDYQMQLKYFLECDFNRFGLLSIADFAKLHEILVGNMEFQDFDFQESLSADLQAQADSMVN